MVVATVQTQKAFHIAESHSELEGKPITPKERPHQNGIAVSFFTALYATRVGEDCQSTAEIWFESGE